MPEHGIRSEADTPLPFHPLVFLEDGEEVTIGRPDTDSYGIFPVDGAHLVRRLEAGATPSQAADWYAAEYGEQVDVDDIIGALRELGFVREEGEEPAQTGPVRWQRLGRALFSPPAWICYGLITAWALWRMICSPDLVPTAEDMLFSEYYAVISLVMLVAAVPLIAIHEAFHALAARRLGIGSRPGCRTASTSSWSKRPWTGSSPWNAASATCRSSPGWSSTSSSSPSSSPSPTPPAAPAVPKRPPAASASRWPSPPCCGCCGSSSSTCAPTCTC
ncbi:hypothetical protein ACFV0H_32915 [Streptomyces erythrochromogenes]|uniref:hypothetical protein n=1 Tax=Streptomyces erythrochromogenes TaxID=285574 RepID=UPI0036C28D48